MDQVKPLYHDGGEKDGSQKMNVNIHYQTREERIQAEEN